MTALPPAPGPAELRQGLLAVSVLRGVDLAPSADGVVLPGRDGRRDVHVPWVECRRALAGRDPLADDGQERLVRWLQARRWAADLEDGELAERLRPAGLPVEHLLHPGLDWVQERVLGGALDLGLAAAGLDPDDPDAVVLLPTPVLDEADVDVPAAWAQARALLEDLGRLAAQLLARDAQARLRPVGDCDAVTLLGARSLRTALAAGSGMASVVVPMLRRGWTRLSLVDPAFAPAAAAATAPAERGFPRPLLVTADEVQQVAEGGRPDDLVLRQPGAADSPWGRAVLRR